MAFFMKNLIAWVMFNDFTSQSIFVYVGINFSPEGKNISLERYYREEHILSNAVGSRNRVPSQNLA